MVAPWLAEQGLATLTRTSLGDRLGSTVLEVGDRAIEVSIARA